MAGLFSDRRITRLVPRTIREVAALWLAGGHGVGKFFLFIVALSIAILVAMTIYIVTL